MSDVPERPEGDDPFEGLPDELRAMFERFADPQAMEDLQQQLGELLGAGGMGAVLPGMGGAPPSGPVDWNLATRVALQLAADGDRPATPDETARAEEALRLAEHWLDATPLPAAPDAGRLMVGTRQTWVNAAVVALRPLVEPVARAATDALVDLAREQFEELGGADGLDGLDALPGMEALPPGITDMVRQMLGDDPGTMLRPASAALTGLQAGQVVGQLAQQLLGQYELGVPTAPRSEAHHLAVNVAEVFEGYDLDPREVDLVLALSEAAHRRLYHAVPWLEAHVQSLVARFAAGTSVDPERLRELSDELMVGVDPEDPDSLREAMARASQLRLRPTDEQRQVLARLQAVVCLVGAWARHEVTRAIDGRLASLDRIEEVLRRRRATRGDGEALLADLLGLDLKPEDESVGERFVTAVEEALGPAGLHRALAHPENLPGADELADPGHWLERTSSADEGGVPDDLSGLDDLSDAPHEASADDRRADRPGSGDGPGGDPGGDDPGDDQPAG